MGSLRPVREKGSVSAFVVCLALTFVIVAGLAIDSGRMVASHIAAADHAENAARVAAQQVGGIRSGERTLDPIRARSAAARYLSRFAVNGEIRIDPTSVVVTVRMVASTTLLRLIGIRDRHVSATRRAGLADG